MGGIRQFEELHAWQEARKLVLAIRVMVKGESWRREYSLADQMLRSARSTMSNVAEGFEANTSAEFNRYLGMAPSSCAELRSHLYEARDAGLIDRDAQATSMAQVKSVSNLVSALKIAVERRMKTTIRTSKRSSSL